MAFTEGYIRSVLGRANAAKGLKTAHADAVKKNWRRYADDFIDEVYRHISVFIGSFKRNQITARFQQSGDDAKIIVSFDENALWRDSLYQGTEAPHWQNYSQRGGKWGTDDIVLQFEKGWSAQGSIHGDWHGRDVWSRRSHSATEMLHYAIESFNQSSPTGVEARLLPPYQ